MKLATLLRQYAGLAEPASQPDKFDLCSPQLPEDVKDWPGDHVEEFRERTAIMEFEGGLPRQEAEDEAQRLIRQRSQNLLISIVCEEHDG